MKVPSRVASVHCVYINFISPLINHVKESFKNEEKKKNQNK